MVLQLPGGEEIVAQDEMHLPAWTLAASGQGVGQTWRVRSDSRSPRAWWMIFEPGGLRSRGLAHG